MPKKNAIRFLIFISLIISITIVVSLKANAQPSLNVNIVVPTEINVCEATNYTIYINNTGNEAVNNIKVNLTLPSDFHYIAGTTNISYPNGTSNIEPIINQQNLTWNLTTIVSQLSINETIKINFSAIAYCNATSSSMQAIVYYDNSSIHATSSSMLVNRGLILIEKLPQEQEAGVGDLVNWTIKVTNIGTGPLFNVTVVDTLQSGLVLNSTTAPSWPVWHYDRIEVGETKIVYVVAKVVKCEDIYNTVNASWGCHGVCQETFAQGSVVLLARPPDISYTIEPSPINIPYCGKAKVWFNVTNSGEGIAKNVRFIVKGIPDEYGIINVTNATFYESNSTLYVGNMDKNSSQNISFYFGPKHGLECSAPYGGTLSIDPKYEDQCDDIWAAPPVGFVSFSRDGGPSIEISKNGPNMVYVGDNITFTITAIYHKGGCSFENITTNITDSFPQGFIVLDSNGSITHGNNLTWYNVTLHDGIPWVKNVTFRNNASCGLILTNSIYSDTLFDCCGCTFSGSSSFTFASSCPQNYTKPKEIAWNKTASPPYTENCHNITYTNNITFNFDADWSDVWFRERGDNGQTFWPGILTHNATFIINGSIYVNHSITVGEWFNLSFLNNYSNLVNGTNLTIVYSLHQWNTGTFVAWSDLNITGHPNPDSCDGMYHAGVWITVDRAVYSISIDIPSVISDGELYNISISISNNSNWDCHDMVVMLNSSNYAYIDNTTFIQGIQYYNETLAKYMNVTSFEPEKIGDYYVWNFSKHGYYRIHTGGNIFVHIVKKCGTLGGIVAILNYKDNCGFSYQDFASDEPSLLTSGDLKFFKTPEETFAYSRQLYWRIYVINKGNGTAFNTVARDILPDNLSYVASFINGGVDAINTTVNGNTVTWNLGSISAGEMIIIDIYANLTGCNYVDNYAEAQWGCGNGQICQHVNDTSKVKLISGRVTTINSMTLIDPCGDEAVGTIVLKNGQVDVYDVNVTEYLPLNLTLVPNSWNVVGATLSSVSIWGNNISWHFAHIDRGATVTITFNVTIASPCAELNEAAIVRVNYTLPCTAYGEEGVDAIIPQKANPHLSITKLPEYIIAKPGNVINWTIVVTSDGDYTAKNITLKDALPSNVEYISSSPSADAGNGSATNPLIWNLPNMSIGDSITINISAKVLECTINDETNNATVTWGCCPLTRESNNAMAYLRTSPDIVVNQSHEDIIPCGGNFTITIHNNGSVTNVSSIWFKLPIDYIYKSGSTRITSSNSSRTFASQEPYDYSSINGTIMWNESNID